jgi:ribosomal protein L40E
MRIEDIEIHVGTPDFEYTAIRKLEAKCEATTVFQSAPTVDEVNARLRAMASKVGANAVIDVQYNSGVSMTSWRSMKGTGLAVQRIADEKACIVCAETIKRAATKCRFCGADQPEAAASQAAAKPGASAPTGPRVNTAPHAEPLKETNNPQLWIFVVAGFVLLMAILGAAGS